MNKNFKYEESTDEYGEKKIVLNRYERISNDGTGERICKECRSLPLMKKRIFPFVDIHGRISRIRGGKVVRTYSDRILLSKKEWMAIGKMVGWWKDGKCKGKDCLGR